jgi:hypothetical protein
MCNLWGLSLKIILLKINPKNLQNLKKWRGTERANSSGSKRLIMHEKYLNTFADSSSATFTKDFQNHL